MEIPLYESLMGLCQVGKLGQERDVVGINVVAGESRIGCCSTSGHRITASIPHR